MSLLAAILALLLLGTTPGHHPGAASAWELDEADATLLKEEVREMFWYSYNAYMQHAFPKDELCPLSCTGKNTWGSNALTLVDTLDMLVIMGNLTEFARASRAVVALVNFDIDKNVSVFETNIRIVGGLLSAHFLAEKHFPASRHSELWEYHGELLSLAVDLATRLLPAFDTPTGIPFGTVNLRHGVPPGETPISSLAGAGTHIIEFGILSKVTGMRVFMDVARTALRSLWARRSPLGLVGTHINTKTGEWTHFDSGIGSNQDSFYEYLLKGYMLFNEPELLEMFEKSYAGVAKHMKKGHWYVDVHMTVGSITLPWFTALSGFWPGLQVLYGDVGSAIATMDSFFSLLHRFGFPPEAYSLQALKVVSGQEGYFLRPEVAESIMYLYGATRDPAYLRSAREMVQAIQHSAWTPCGYAVITNVSTHKQGDRMESFFLSETLKYLYLTFDHDNFIHQGNYVFNTEAHYMPMRSEWMQGDSVLQEEEESDDDEEEESGDPVAGLRTLCPLQPIGVVWGPHVLGPFYEEPIWAVPEVKRDKRRRTKGKRDKAPPLDTESNGGKKDQSADVSSGGSGQEIEKAGSTDTSTAKTKSSKPVSKTPPSPTSSDHASITLSASTAVDNDDITVTINANSAATATLHINIGDLSQAAHAASHSQYSPSTSPVTSSAVAPITAPGLASQILTLLGSLDLTSLIARKPPAPVETPALSVEQSCARHRGPSSFWGYYVCFGHSVVQYHPAPKDETKHALENSLGDRHIASALKSAKSLAAAEDIVRGFTRDCDDSVMPDAVFVHEYTHGDKCGENMHRSATVGYFCTEGLHWNQYKVVVEEPRTCHYDIQVSSSQVCTL